MWHAWLLSGVLIEEGERVVAMAEHHARCAQTHAALVGVARRGVSRRYARRVASASVAWRRGSPAIAKLGVVLSKLGVCSVSY